MCERSSHKHLLAVSTLTQIIAPTQTSKGSSGDGPQRYDFSRFHLKNHKYMVQTFSFFGSILSFSFYSLPLSSLSSFPCFTSIFLKHIQTKLNKYRFSFLSNIKDPIATQNSMCVIVPCGFLK